MIQFFSSHVMHKQAYQQLDQRRVQVSLKILDPGIKLLKNDFSKANKNHLPVPLKTETWFVNPRISY